MRCKESRKPREKHFLPFKVFLSVLSVKRIILDCENWRLQVRTSRKQSQKMMVMYLVRSKKPGLERWFRG